MEVSLKPVTEDSLYRVPSATGRGSGKICLPPLRSPDQAYVYRDQCQPFGVYADDRMAGCVMVICDYDVPEYDIWHLMIDRAFQGKGCGKAAVEKCLEYIDAKPFGASNRVALTCYKDNKAALRLYQSLGFRFTGAEDDGEFEMALYR